MKKLIAFGFVAVMALSACGGDKCQELADKLTETSKSYCSGKDSTCTYCECVNGGKMLKTTVDGTEVKFSCEAIPASTTTTTATCTEANAKAAETCLNEGDACATIKAVKDGAEAGCNATKK